MNELISEIWLSKDLSSAEGHRKSSALEGEGKADLMSQLG